MRVRRSPCGECPFGAATKPKTTGGAHPFTYLGQVRGPFLLPCHMQIGYAENKKKPTTLQCSGAAQFRGRLIEEKGFSFPDSLAIQTPTEAVVRNTTELTAKLSGLSIEATNAVFEEMIASAKKILPAEIALDEKYDFRDVVEEAATAIEMLRVQAPWLSVEDTTVLFRAKIASAIIKKGLIALVAVEAQTENAIK